ncbi:hypothetical protein Dsin_009049 [Dipteronia sinensis]|uniref:Uncharacterized protein n=1 Tax=Dipteronia sinensis TaxID=43782 RepID=A0AAE0EBJ1_9ROSI|nr:hypothetical protein Dsin_009049 [Dipteronia sinensis]
MKLKINKACDPRSISVSPPHSSFFKRIFGGHFCTDKTLIAEAAAVATIAKRCCNTTIRLLRHCLTRSFSSFDHVAGGGGVQRRRWTVVKPRRSTTARLCLVRKDLQRTEVNHDGDVAVAEPRSMSALGGHTFVGGALKR